MEVVEGELREAYKGWKERRMGEIFFFFFGKECDSHDAGKGVRLNVQRSLFNSFTAGLMTALKKTHNV